MLIETDILVSEWINILLSQWKAIIGSCKNIKVNLNVTTLSNQINWLLLSNDQMIILIYDFTAVQIKPLHELPTDQDLLFKPECKLAYAYTSIVDHTLTSIEIWNDSDWAVIISHHTSLDWIIKYEADSCFLTSSDLLSQALKTINWVKSIFWTLLAAFHCLSYNLWSHCWIRVNDTE